MTYEHRRHERIKETKAIQYRKGLFSGSEQTVTMDMSLGGLCFFSKEKIKIGNLIKVRVFDDRKSPEKFIKGRVVWTKEYSDAASKGYLNGLSFLRS
jgi:hypothetical protein